MNKHKSNLTILISLPRAGKDTYCNIWTEKANRVVVSGDKIRLALSGERYNSYINDYVFAIEKTMIHSLLLSGYEVLANDCHTTWKTIRPLLELDPEAQFEWIPYQVKYKNSMNYYNTLSTDFDLHIQECIARAHYTHQPDLESVIRRYAANLVHLQHDWDNQLIIERANARMHQHTIREK